jgi:hypothetical protein
LPSRACWRGGSPAVGLELGVDGVADPPLERAECFLAGLALAGLLLEVGSAVAVLVADLGDRRHVNSVVESAVAAPGQPEDGAFARGRFDRRGAVVGGEVVAAGKPGDVGDVAQDGGGNDRADAEQAGQGGAGRFDCGRDRRPGPGELAVEVSQVSDILGCQLMAGRLGRTGWDHIGEQSFGGRRGDLLGNSARDDLAQGGVQSAGGLAAQPGQVAMPFSPHLQHGRVPVGQDSTACGRAEGGDRDRAGVVRVALARPPR